MRPGTEGWKGRPELPDVRGPRRPTGSGDGLARERIAGLAAIGLGVLGLGGVAFTASVFFASGNPAQALARGGALALLAPLITLASLGLILLGLKRLLNF